jgi:hypothetical protein
MHTKFSNSTHSDSGPGRDEPLQQSILGLLSRMELTTHQL